MKVTLKPSQPVHRVEVLVSQSAAANPFLMADGMINVAAIIALGKALDKVNSLDPSNKPTGVYCFLKKEPIKFNASLNTKGDHKYLVGRAIEVKKYARPPRVVRPMLLNSYAGLGRELMAKQRQAIAAIVAHNKKADKVRGTVKGEKADIRDAMAKAFDANLEVLLPMLTAQGIKDANIFVGSGMFGKQVFVTLPNKGVVTVGKSNAEALKKAKLAARKAATSQSSDSDEEGTGDYLESESAVKPFFANQIHALAKKSPEAIMKLLDAAKADVNAAKSRVATLTGVLATVKKLHKAKAA